MKFWIWKTEIAFFVNLFLQCMNDIMETWMNKWMMHLYSALLCIVVHPKRFTIMWGGGVSPQWKPNQKGNCDYISHNSFFLVILISYLTNSDLDSQV